MVEHFLTVFGYQLCDALQLRLVFRVDESGLFVEGELTGASLPFLQFGDDEWFGVLGGEAYDAAKQ